MCGPCRSFAGGTTCRHLVVLVLQFVKAGGMTGPWPSPARGAAMCGVAAKSCDRTADMLMWRRTWIVSYIPSRPSSRRQITQSQTITLSKRHGARMIFQLVSVRRGEGASRILKQPLFTMVIPSTLSARPDHPQGHVSGVEGIQEPIEAVG